jgi:hypothetical protein
MTYIPDHTGSPAGPAGQPAFFTVAHDDPFWRRQAELLEPVWRAGRFGPNLGITWERGRIADGPGWIELLPDFDEPITCDPARPDDELRGLLGECLTDLRRVCEDLRFNRVTTTQIGSGFLVSVLCETEVRA